MLDIDCDDCGRVLIGPGRIASVRSTAEGIRIGYVCPCGRHGEEVTGRRPAGPPAPARAGAPGPLAGSASA